MTVSCSDSEDDGSYADMDCLRILPVFERRKLLRSIS